jgi:hypothetical protein
MRDRTACNEGSLFVTKCPCESFIFRTRRSICGWGIALASTNGGTTRQHTSFNGAPGGIARSLAWGRILGAPMDTILELILKFWAAVDTVIWGS